MADILGVLECVAGFGKLLPGTGMAKVGRHAVPYDRRITDCITLITGSGSEMACMESRDVPGAGGCSEGKGEGEKT